MTYYDQDAGAFLQRDSTILDCFVKDSVIALDNGVILVNCNENTFCEQEVEVDLDDCNLGTITRTFKIWKSCGNEVPDTVEKSQIIDIRNYCELSKDLFELPADTMLIACAPEFDPAGSGNVVGEAHPDSIGRPIYKLNDCRMIGLAHEDKVLTIANATETCYLVTRTWYFADWCLNTEMPLWWQNQSLVVDTFVQLIVLSDTTDPTCDITFEGAVNDTLNASSCLPTLAITLDFADSCGLVEFAYRLDSITDLGSELRASGMETITGKTDAAMLEIPIVGPGDFEFYVRITDECGNESTCRDTLTVLCDVSVSAGLVQGLIANEMGDVVDHTKMMIETNALETVIQEVDRLGYYHHQGVANDVLHLAPLKDGDDKNGISTADLILIQKHLLGKQMLPNKYRRRAADANNDGKIGAIDIITLRKLILGIEDELPKQ